MAHWPRSMSKCSSVDCKQQQGAGSMALGLQGVTWKLLEEEAARHLGEGRGLDTWIPRTQVCVPRPSIGSEALLPEMRMCPPVHGAAPPTSA